MSDKQLWREPWFSGYWGDSKRLWVCITAPDTGRPLYHINLLYNCILCKDLENSSRLSNIVKGNYLSTQKQAKMRKRSVNRLGYFWKFWQQIFLQKYPEYLITFGLFWKHHFKIKNCCIYFCRNLIIFLFQYLVTLGTSDRETIISQQKKENQTDKLKSRLRYEMTLRTLVSSFLMRRWWIPNEKMVDTYLHTLSFH